MSEKKILYEKINGGVKVIDGSKIWDVDIESYVYDLWSPLIGTDAIGVYGFLKRLVRNGVVAKLTIKKMAKACRKGDKTFSALCVLLKNCGFIRMRTPTESERHDGISTVFQILEPPKVISAGLIKTYAPDGDPDKYESITHWFFAKESDGEDDTEWDEIELELQEPDDEAQASIDDSAGESTSVNRRQCSRQVTTVVREAQASPDALIAPSIAPVILAPVILAPLILAPPLAAVSEKTPKRAAEPAALEPVGRFVDGIDLEAEYVELEKEIERSKAAPTDDEILVEILAKHGPVLRGQNPYWNDSRRSKIWQKELGRQVAERKKGEQKKQSQVEQIAEDKKAANEPAKAWMIRFMRSELKLNVTMESFDKGDSLTGEWYNPKSYQNSKGTFIQVGSFADLYAKELGFVEWAEQFLKYKNKDKMNSTKRGYAALQNLKWLSQNIGLYFADKEKNAVKTAPAELSKEEQQRRALEYGRKLEEEIRREAAEDE